MSLKVFDLQCEHGHVFEGWFASADAYESQKANGLLSCPVCNSSAISRKVSAARLNVGNLKRERLAPSNAVPAQAGGSSGTAGEGGAGQAPGAGDMARIQAEFIRHVRKLVREAENVGNRFAEESRRMHHGESEERAIRGTATPQEREELAEEGISVMAIPDFFDDDRLQ
ncbi:DUF1178 family protein [Alcaligenaceae bacterium]|nr:DUF1178 family protein [Alcaligenaceae bacterium]